MEDKNTESSSDDEILAYGVLEKSKNYQVHWCEYYVLIICVVWSDGDEEMAMKNIRLAPLKQNLCFTGTINAGELELKT